MVEVDCAQPDDAFRMSLPKILESANQGTVLLAGLGALSLRARGELMRAVETWQVVYAGRTLKINVRYLATAMPELHGIARAARFRLDLFCRLSGFTIIVPETLR
jgi:two-component system NtrC family response regulator